MNSSYALVIAVGLVVSGQLVHAQELSRYRAYVLESSVDTVVTTIGARATKASTDAFKRIAQEVEQRPLILLAVAAGVGFLFGMARK